MGLRTLSNLCSICTFVRSARVVKSPDLLLKTIFYLKYMVRRMGFAVVDLLSGNNGYICLADVEMSHKMLGAKIVIRRRIAAGKVGRRRCRWARFVRN